MTVGTRGSIPAIRRPLTLPRVVEAVLEVKTIEVVGGWDLGSRVLPKRLCSSGRRVAVGA